MGPMGKGRGSWRFRMVRSRGLELSLGSEKKQVEERASSDKREKLLSVWMSLDRRPVLRFGVLR